MGGLPFSHGRAIWRAYAISAEVKHGTTLHVPRFSTFYSVLLASCWQVYSYLVDSVVLRSRSDTMPTIVASNNLTIQIENNTWSLHNGRGDSVPAIVQAQTDGISYRPSFATARHLPPEGRLAGNHITMVVVGWAVEDSSWHLGIMVTPEIAHSRGGRWCGLARWNHFDGESAEEAGRALADTLNKPFRLVPPPEPQSETQDAVSETYAPPDVVYAPLAQPSP